ncbi:hypothetical protein H5968_09070 [Sphaerospermopsis sp. LEGE 00249]|uniref:KGK domain-containing protein n=1 Tax=Sphaerospermopsis sp. LEGE 00249 TaxID=1380707 RepID=UPI00164E7A5D|nr:KGK domain-containing protein [Sphaerospermopsis sp. LEGE 00249]MBC5795294.1 hypothetical protein [Sphaerospermopsis sp. LEGE 00249]
MKHKFIPLDCDDDILLINKDTFKVDRLKELVLQEIQLKLNYENTKTQQNAFGEIFIVDTYLLINSLKNIFIGENELGINDINFHINISNCQFLKIGGKGWKTGQLQINISISPNRNNPDNVYLEFSPDQPEEPESPLDDLRKMINNT